jgi:hypothetical protein
MDCVAYCARTVSYTHKMFMKLTPGVILHKTYFLYH